MSRMGKAIGVFAATLAATTFATAQVRAEPGVPGSFGGVDWSRLVVQLDGVARGRGAGLESGTSSRSNTPMQLDVRTSQLVVQNAGNAWFGVAPRVTLVARDWGTAFRLAGDRLSLVDSVRLTASTRMVMGRVRIANPDHARVVPFLQFGAGQWRTDPNVLPYTRKETEVAAQVGTGVEVRLASFWQLACETSATMLVRDGRGEGATPQTRMWSSSIASRIAF